jgi:hypothetical protein
MIRSARTISTWLIRILLFFLDSSARQLHLQTQKIKTVENHALKALHMTRKSSEPSQEKGRFRRKTENLGREKPKICAELLAKKPAK